MATPNDLRQVSSDYIVPGIIFVAGGNLSAYSIGLFFQITYQSVNPEIGSLTSSTSSLVIVALCFSLGVLLMFMSFMASVDTLFERYVN